MTPPEFYDLFCLCLYWQWDENTLRKCWTTVDKVARILNAMGLMSNKERKLIAKDRRVQHQFLRRGKLIALASVGPARVHSDNRCWDDDWDKRREQLLADSSPLLISIRATRDLDRVRLLQDHHIFLTHKGAEYARSVASKYAARINQAKYVAKCEELSAGLEDAAIASMCVRYRSRIEQEADDRRLQKVTAK